MKRSLVIVLISLVLSAPMFAQSTKTPFNGSVENTEISVYPKELTDFLKDTKAIASIKTARDLMNMTTKLYKIGEVNEESKMGITLSKASVFFFCAKIVESIKTKEIKQTVFLELASAFYRAKIKAEKTEDYLLLTFANIFDIVKKESVAAYLLRPANGSHSDSPTISMDPSDLSFTDIGLDPADTNAYRDSDIAATLACRYLLKNIANFSDLKALLEKVGKSFDQELDEATKDNSYNDSDRLDSSLVLLRKIMQIALERELEFKNEKFDSAKIYAHIGRLSTEQQYRFLNEFVWFLISKDKDNLSMYLKDLVKKEFRQSNVNSLSNLLFGAVQNGNATEVQNGVSEKNFSKELDQLVKVYFPTMTSRQVAHLIAHWGQIEHWNSKRSNNFYAELGLSQLVDAKRFVDFVVAYYQSNFYKKLPVDKMSKELMDTIRLFQTPEDPAYKTKFIDLVNGFDKPLFVENIRDKTYLLSSLYRANARDEVFTQSQLKAVQFGALNYANGEPAKLRASKAILSQLQRVNFDLAVLPEFDPLPLFKLLPEGTTLKNYRANLDEDSAQMISTKKLKFTFDKDKIQDIFEYDTYASFRDSLSFDEFVEAYTNSLTSSKLPDLLKTNQYRENKLDFVARISDYIDSNEGSLRGLMSNISTSNFSELTPLLAAKFNNNIDLLSSLMVGSSQVYVDRAYALINAFEEPLSEFDFGLVLYTFLATNAPQGEVESDAKERFEIVASKAPKLFLAELFRYESNFESLILNFLLRQKFDSRIIGQLDDWAMNWKKLYDYASKNLDTSQLKDLTNNLTKNKIEFKANFPLKKTRSAGDPGNNFFETNYINIEKYW